MKKTLLAAVLLCCSFHLKAQDVAEKAVFSYVYLTGQDAKGSVKSYPNSLLINNPDSKKAPLRVSYNHVFTDEGMKTKGISKIVKDSWGVVFKDELYVNKRIFQLTDFAKVHTTGRYMLIFSEIPPKADIQKNLQIPDDVLTEHRRMQSTKNTGMMFGAVGAAIASASIKTIYVPIVIDSEDYSVLAVSDKYLEALSERYPEIASLAQPADGFTDEELVDYFNRINALISTDDAGLQVKKIEEEIIVLEPDVNFVESVEVIDIEPAGDEAN